MRKLSAWSTERAQCTGQASQDLVWGDAQAIRSIPSGSCVCASPESHVQTEAGRSPPQPSSALVFPKQRSGERALQAVTVTSARRRAAAVSGGEDGGLRPYTFTFCMERVQSGPYKVRGLTRSLVVARHKALLHAATLRVAF